MLILYSSIQSCNITGVLATASTGVLPCMGFATLISGKKGPACCMAGTGQTWCAQFFPNHERVKWSRKHLRWAIQLANICQQNASKTWGDAQKGILESEISELRRWFQTSHQQPVGFNGKTSPSLMEQTHKLHCDHACLETPVSASWIQQSAMNVTIGPMSSLNARFFWHVCHVISTCRNMFRSCSYTIGVHLAFRDGKLCFMAFEKNPGSPWWLLAISKSCQSGGLEKAAPSIFKNNGGTWTTMKISQTFKKDDSKMSRRYL